MNVSLAFLPLLVVLAGSPPSDPSGVYAVVDDVVFHPNATAPQRVEVRGAFAIAQGRHGDYYTAPRTGVLVLVAPDGKLADCVAQWRDLKRMAGSGTIVTFSSRYSQKDVTVLTGDAAAIAAAKPGIHGTDFGVNKVENQDWGPAAALRRLPRPLAPVGVGPSVEDGGRYNGHEVEFRIANAPDAGDARYVFTVDTGREQFCSDPIAAGERETTWKANVFLLPGDTVTWRVHVVGGTPANEPRGHFHFDRMPVAEAKFTVGRAAKQDR
jgi:hypothetical protein